MLPTCCRLTSRSLRLDRVTALGPNRIDANVATRTYWSRVCQIERLLLSALALAIHDDVRNNDD